MKTASVFLAFTTAVTSLFVVHWLTAATEAKDATAIHSFTVPTVPQKDLDDLRRRVAATRWPERETVADDTQGVQLATMKALAAYRDKTYGWRKCEAKLKALPHFVTNIDGLDIHVPAKSWAEKAYPKLIHFNRLDKGGHFAAWEQPELFVNEIRASFKSFR